MSIPTFSPPMAPSVESTRTMKPRVLTAAFGDGYEQRAPDGLNAQLEKLTVVWSRLKPVDRRAITEFFEARAGAEAFSWTAPRDTAPKLWIAESWDVGYTNQMYESVRAQFREVVA